MTVPRRVAVIQSSARVMADGRAQCAFPSRAIATRRTVCRTDAAARLQSLVEDAARATAAGDRSAAPWRSRSRRQRSASGHPSLLRIRAEALRDAGRIGEAGSAAQSRAQSRARRSGHDLDIGRLLVAEQRIDEAVAAYQAAIALRPDLLDAWNALGCSARRRRAIACPREPRSHGPLSFLLQDPGSSRQSCIHGCPCGLSRVGAGTRERGIATAAGITRWPRWRSSGPTWTNSSSSQRASVSSRC